MTEAIETIKKKMERQLQRGQNCERTNAKYRTLLAEYYENKFKNKDYEILHRKNN